MNLRFSRAGSEATDRAAMYVCMYRIPQIFRVGKYWRMASSLSFAFKIFADAASCEKGDWEQQLPSRIKISRMICEPRKPRNFSYSKYLRYTVCM